MAVLLQDDRPGSGAPHFVVTERGYSVSHYPGAVSPDSSARVCVSCLSDRSEMIQRRRGRNTMCSHIFLCNTSLLITYGFSPALLLKCDIIFLSG